MSCSSGLGLARGSWPPWGTWPWPRSCPRRVSLSAREWEVFGNAVTRWARRISAKLHLPKQVHLDFRAPRWQRTVECVELAPPTDRSSKCRCSFSTSAQERWFGPAFTFPEQLPCLKAPCTLTPALGRWWDKGTYALAVPWIFWNTISWSFYQKTCCSPGIVNF